jgi:hypothetical protein
MIRVIYHARLGNNMFQYALGRLLAERMGYALSEEIRPGANYPFPFPNTWQQVNGVSVSDPIQHINQQRLDINALLADSSRRLIQLDGFFQIADYYLPHIKEIREWFKPSHDMLARLETRFREVNCDDLLIYIRLGDYGWQSLTPQFYLTVIRQTSPRNIYITTDDPNNSYFEAFNEYSPYFLSGTAIEDLLAARFFKRIVLSCSTFAWWAALLADPDEVHFPICEKGFWSEEYNRNVPTNEIDLRIDDPRYRYYYNCPQIGDNRISKGLISLSNASVADMVRIETLKFHHKSTALWFV